MKVTLQHRGWFGICPVHIGDIESDCPFLIERHWAFQPLFVISEFMFAATAAVASLLDDDFEPMRPIRVTGELAEPIVHDLEFEDA